MSWLEFGIHVAIAVAAIAVDLFLRNFIPSYMNKKGENLATKEDVQEIIKLTEDVQKEFKESLSSSQPI